MTWEIEIRLKRFTLDLYQKKREIMLLPFISLVNMRRKVICIGFLPWTLALAFDTEEDEEDRGIFYYKNNTLKKILAKWS